MQLAIETTLAKLVSIPSVSSNTVACHEILEYVQHEIDPLDLFMTGDSNAANPWLLATTKATRKPDILLAAHLDVVPAPPELFVMKKREGKLYGRGVYDMKLAAACYLELFKTHINALRNLNIGLLFTTDEEIGGACIHTILEDGWQPKVVFIPDGGDNWHVEERAKGLCGVALTARGITGHGSRPWEGENALHTLMDVLSVLRQSFPSSSPADSTLAVNELHAGTAFNQIADYATAKIDFRSFSKEELAAYSAQLDQLADTYHLEVQVIHEGSPLLFNKNASVVQGFLHALREQTNKEVNFCESYGVSDGRHFALHDIPCIIIEPYGGGRHGPGEWLLTDDLSNYYQLIERWLLPSISK